MKRDEQDEEKPVALRFTSLREHLALGWKNETVDKWTPNSKVDENIPKNNHGYRLRSCSCFSK